MKFSLSIAAIVAPILVLSAPIEKFQSGQDEIDIIRPFPVLIPEEHKGPSILPVETGPGLINLEDDLPASTGEKSDRKDPTLAELLNRPGPVMPSIPPESIPGLTKSGVRKQEKRSDDGVVATPDSVLTAPHPTYRDNEPITPSNIISEIDTDHRKGLPVEPSCEEYWDRNEECPWFTSEDMLEFVSYKDKPSNIWPWWGMADVA